MSPYEVYQNNQLNVDSKEDLLLATFEEIMSKLNILALAIKDRYLERKVEEIEKIISALEVLRASLDFEKGGEIAKNLDAIYAFCVDELIKANLTNNVEYVQNVKEVLSAIYDGFKEAAKSINK